MGWEGLDDKELAEMLIDKERNGGRSFEDLIHHMDQDHLILWAWLRFFRYRTHIIAKRVMDWA